MASRNHKEEMIEIVIPSNTKYLHSLRSLTKTLAESMGFGRKESEKTAIAAEEAISNVIEHAYHGEEDHSVQVIYQMEDQKLTIRILHSGDQIENTKIPSANDLSQFYKQNKKGGLGIVIMKKFMDEVTYKSDSGQNECCMIKYLKRNDE